MLKVNATITNIDEIQDETDRLLENGKLCSAERLLRRLLTVDPNCLVAHFQLARVYRRTGEYKLALRHAHRTLKLSPNEWNAYLNLGLIHDLMGRDKLAAFYFKKELSRNPGSVETSWNLGRLYFRNRRWLHASKHLRHCFETGFAFEMEDTVAKLGACYHKLHDVQSYIEVFTSYVQLVPDAAWAFVNLGRALLHVRDYKDAVFRLSTAKRLGRGSAIESELVRAKEMLWKRYQKTIRGRVTGEF